MKLLSRSEEIIMLSIWRLQKNAYGIAIRQQMIEVTGKNCSFGAVYPPLSRLLKKGYIRAIEGEPTAARGGRRKIYYQLTDEGKQMLVEIQKINQKIWLGLPSLATD